VFRDLESTVWDTNLIEGIPVFSLSFIPGDCTVFLENTVSDGARCAWNGKVRETRNQHLVLSISEVTQ
jgi:hypothetical protein